MRWVVAVGLWLATHQSAPLALRWVAGTDCGCIGPAIGFVGVGAQLLLPQTRCCLFVAWAGHVDTGCCHGTPRQSHTRDMLRACALECDHALSDGCMLSLLPDAPDAADHHWRSITDPCHYCHTSVSPAWRSAYEGGPRVYCNACAMRFRSTGSFEYRNKSSGRKVGSPTKSARRCVVLYIPSESLHHTQLSATADDFAPVTPNRRPYELTHDYESPSGMRVRHIRRSHDDPEWVLPSMKVPPPPPMSVFGIYHEDGVPPVPALFGWGAPSTPPARSASIGIKRRAASDLADSYMLDFYSPGVVRCSTKSCA